MARTMSVSNTVVMSNACGEVWPFRIWKILSQRNRMPTVAMPTTELAKKNITKRRKMT